MKDRIIVTARVNKHVHGSMETIVFDFGLKDLIYKKLDKNGYFKKIIEKIDFCYEYEGDEILQREASERKQYKYLKEKYEGSE